MLVGWQVGELQLGEFLNPYARWSPARQGPQRRILLDRPVRRGAGIRTGFRRRFHSPAGPARGRGSVIFPDNRATVQPLPRRGGRGSAIPSRTRALVHYSAGSRRGRSPGTRPRIPFRISKTRIAHRGHLSLQTAQTAPTAKRHEVGSGRPSPQTSPCPIHIAKSPSPGLS
jgi:hypothetical protein